MTTDEGIVYDRSLLGVESQIGTFELTREMILGFAISTSIISSNGSLLYLTSYLLSSSFLIGL